ncbi:MAG: aminotransferase class I/II-fold pyridoxal phosphate-dependent enzyme [Lachnospiraceae bacterium]|nr:aminotransferase class I/II-fold pyridoxal phosphate-dependent enzyme [Lachnospiraceae bacterium]
MSHGGDIFRNKVNIDFSVNLNPYDISEKILEAIGECKDEIGHYPDIKQESLRNALAKAEGVYYDNVIAGNGASELLLAIVRAIDPKKALIINPCFSLYRDYLNTLKKCEIKDIFLNEKEGFRLTEDILSGILEDTDIMFLTDPWNPVGFNIDNELLIKIIDKAKSLNIKVVLDQSFLMMSDKAKSFDTFKFLERYDDLIMVRSYTKCFSCPGIRMGYVISSPENIKKIKRQLPEWNMPVISSHVMERCALLSKDESFTDSTLKLIKKERDHLICELKKLDLKVYESDTSFIMFYSKEDLYEKMLDKGILIRDLSDMFENKGGFYRVAIKDHESNKILIRCLKEVINGD